MTGTSHEFESWANCLAKLEVFSCSAIAGVTLQLPLHASHVCHSGNFANREIQSRCPSWVHTFECSSYSLTLPLHNSHLNTGYLIAKLQENLARNLDITCELGTVAKTHSHPNSRNREALEPCEQVFPKNNYTRWSLQAKILKCIWSKHNVIK